MDRSLLLVHTISAPRKVPIVPSHLSNVYTDWPDLTNPTWWQPTLLTSGCWTRHPDSSHASSRAASKSLMNCDTANTPFLDRSTMEDGAVLHGAADGQLPCDTVGNVFSHPTWRSLAWGSVAAYTLHRSEDLSPVQLGPTEVLAPEYSA